ncbi:MAG: hypothetical protein CME32_19590 [Gimesia sp.]|nr:hypothetical protein [Gimesia sp.]
MSQPLDENRGEIPVGTLGDLVGIPLTDELVELLLLWKKLSDKQRESLLTGLREEIRDVLR